jgi:LemA protein
MSTPQIVFWAVFAVLLFWSVGAYNRLIGLRSVLVRAFGAVDEQFRQRQGLLLQLADALGPALADAPQPLEALRVACAQAEAACGRARSRPTAAGIMTSLRLAEDILAEARQRLPADALAEASLASLQTELTASDHTLAFARRQFNDSVNVYNQAVRQFPTWVIAGLFRFHRAGTL